VYRYARKFGSPIDALEVARDYCIVFMFCASLITMGLMGSHRGCRRLVQVRNIVYIKHIHSLINKIMRVIVGNR
jgi:hypothetical protein